MTYSVIGVGAIGGYYGGRLANAGLEVNFLLHSDYAYVVEHGLRVDSCDGDFHRPMEIYYLYSRPIEEARKAGFAMPKLAMLEALLKFHSKT